MTFKKVKTGGRVKYTGTCDVCQTSDTPKWYRKAIPGKVICTMCYSKHRYKNKEIREKRLVQRQSWSSTYNNAVKLARDKGMKLDMGRELWMEKTKLCFYCGRDISKDNGIKLDRVDNSIGYTDVNTVGCCRQCNVAKNNYSLEDFKKWIKSVHANLFGES